MWSGLTTGLSGALHSLDQAARDVISVELEDEDGYDSDGNPIEYGDEDRDSAVGEGNGDDFGADHGAYDSPFGAVARPGVGGGGQAEGGEADGSSEPQPGGAWRIGDLSGTLAGVSGAAALMTSVATKSKIGEVGGNLWERSSAMRERVSMVTKDVASAMKEEIAGATDVVSGLVTVGSDGAGSASGSEDAEPAAEDPSLAFAADTWDASVRDGGGWSIAGDLGAMADMQAAGGSDFVELDQDAFDTASLEPIQAAAPAVDAAEPETDGGVSGMVDGQEDGSGSVGGLLGSMNKVAGNLSTVNTDTLLGGASKLGQVGSELWSKSSGVRESLSNVTKDVASAMTEEVKGIVSIVAADDEDGEEEEEADEYAGSSLSRKNKPGVLSLEAGGGDSKGDGASPQGMQTMQAAEGLHIELEGLEMEREMLQARGTMLEARVLELEEENRLLQSKLDACVHDGPGNRDAPAGGGKELSVEAFGAALATVQEAMVLCEKHLEKNAGGQGRCGAMEAALAQLKESLAGLNARDAHKNSLELVTASVASADVVSAGVVGQTGVLEQKAEQSDREAALEAQVEQLKTKLGKKEELLAMVRDAQSQTEASKQRIVELEEAGARAAAELRAAASDKAALEQQLADLTEAMSAARAKVEAAEAAAAAEIDEASTARNAAASELARALEDLAVAQSAGKEAAAEAAQLRAALVAAEAKNVAAGEGPELLAERESTIAVLTEKLAALEARGLEAIGREKDAHAAALAAQDAEHVQKLAASSQRVVDLECDIGASAERVRDLEAEVGQLRSELMAASTEAHRLTELQGQAQAAADGASAQRVSELEGMLAQAETDRGHAEADKRDLEERMAAMSEGGERGLQDLAEQLAVATEERARTSAEVERVTSALKQCEEKHAVAQARIAELEEQVLKVEGEKDAERETAREAALAAEAAAATADETVKKLTEQVSALEEVKETLGASLKDKMQEQITQLEQLDKAMADKLVLEERVAALVADEASAVRDVSAQLASTQEDLAQERAASAAAQEASVQARREADHATSQLQQAGEERDKLVRRVEELEAMCAEPQTPQAAAALEEACLARQRAEEELAGMRTSSKKEGEQVLALLQTLGVAPLGDKLERLDAVQQGLVETMKAKAMLQQKVELLEALRAEHEDLLAQAQARAEAAPSPSPADKAGAGSEELSSELLTGLRSLCDSMRLDPAESAGAWAQKLEEARTRVVAQEEHAGRLMDKIAELESWRAEHFSSGEETAKEMQDLLDAAQKAADADRAKAGALEAQVVALRTELEQTEREAKGVISAWEAKVAQLNDELEDAQAAAEDAAVARQEAVEAVRAEEEERFAREVGMLRGALEKLRADVSVTSQETQMRGFEAERLEEEKAILENELVQVREEVVQAQRELESAKAASETDCLALRAQTEEMQMKLEEAEAACKRATDERDRIQSVLESFHEQNMKEASYEVDKLRSAAAARERDFAALQEREAALQAEVAELRRAPQPAEEAAKLQEVAAERDGLVLRLDEMAVELRKARMFAAASDYYIDRRLVSNILISYFSGNKAGSDEVLKLVCSILAMEEEQGRAVVQGAGKLRAGGGWGLYSVISAPVSTWETITEAEIGQDWVQFLIDEADKAAAQPSLKG